MERTQEEKFACKQRSCGQKFNKTTEDRPSNQTYQKKNLQ